MQDRLQDLKSRCKRQDLEFIPEVQGRPSLQQGFLNVVSQAQQLLTQVHDINLEVEKLRKQYVLVAMPEKEKGHTHTEMNSATNLLVTKSRTCLNRVKIILEEMKKDLEEKKEQNPSNPESRMRDNMYTTLVKRFEEMLIECDNSQTNFRQDVKKKVANQVKLCTFHSVDDTATDEQIEHLIEHPEQVQRLAEQALIGASVSTIHMVEELQDRYNEITALAKVRVMQSIEDMHQMFLDLAVLIHHQGEMLDTIEKHVDTAVNYVEKAGKALEAAKEHQKSARWVRTYTEKVLFADRVSDSAARHHHSHHQCEGVLGRCSR